MFQLHISSRPLDKTETQVLSYGLKHSVTPKRIPTEAIVSRVEAVLSRQRELSESTKNNIRSRIASTIQSASLPDSNLTKDERKALKRLNSGKDIVILPADKGLVTVQLWTRHEQTIMTKWTRLLTRDLRSTTTRPDASTSTST